MKQKKTVTVADLESYWNTFKDAKIRSMDKSQDPIGALAENILDENEVDILFANTLDMFIVGIQIHIFNIPPLEIKRENMHVRKFLNSLTRKEKKFGKPSPNTTPEEKAVIWMNKIITAWNARL